MKFKFKLSIFILTFIPLFHYEIKELFRRSFWA